MSPFRKPPDPIVRKQSMESRYEVVSQAHEMKEDVLLILVYSGSICMDPHWVLDCELLVNMNLYCMYLKESAHKRQMNYELHKLY